MQKTVFLIDASIYIFRAWFSVPDSMRGDQGQPINAVYGFSRFLTEFVERSEATHVAVAFDESLTTSFRNEIYPQYKMNRELPPQELEQQFSLCRRVAKAAGLYCVAHRRYEADDLIATLARDMRDSGYQVVIVSRDKDLTQLLHDNDYWWDFAGQQKLRSTDVLDKFGVMPEFIPDYLGLCGDAVDNIPGVAGVGPKTASALLQHFQTIDELYVNLHQVPDLKIRGAKTLVGKLRAGESLARLSKQLATVVSDAPIACGESLLKRGAAEQSEFKELSQILGNRGQGLFDRLTNAARLVRA